MNGQQLIKDNGDGSFTAQAGVTISMSSSGACIDIGIVIFRDNRKNDSEKMWEFIKENRPDIVKLIEAEYLQKAIAELVDTGVSEGE